MEDASSLGDDDEEVDLVGLNFDTLSEASHGTAESDDEV